MQTMQDCLEGRKPGARTRAQCGLQTGKCGERLKASKATYRKAHPERVNRAAAKWRRANPESVRVTHRLVQQNRRARIKGNGGKLSMELAEKLFKLQRGKCPCCRQPLGDNYHLDHVVPLALGGLNADNNMQLLRDQCNKQKHAKHPVNFMQERGFLL